MPEMNGLEVLERLRADPRLADIPVILLTSVDLARSDSSISRLKLAANLTKPTRSSLLFDTITEVLSGARRSIDPAGIGAAPLPAASEPKSEPASHQEAPATDKPAAAEPRAASAAGEIDILVAEDNEVNQIVMEQILRDSGHSFRIVANGRLAVSAYRVHRPKLILMDVSMPEMNGHEATREIRAIEAEAGGHVPIVGVTAHALKGDMEKCMEAGMDDYLSKPVSPARVIEKLDHWLADGRQQTQAA